MFPMPSPSHVCPACGLPALKCYRTLPDHASALHSLELARQSLWECRACGAVFALFTPSGTLTRLRRKRR